MDTGNSILSEITKSELSKKVGHFGYNISYLNDEGILLLLMCRSSLTIFILDHQCTLSVVVKSKTTAIETCNMLNKMAQECGLRLAVLYEKCKMKLGFK